jgi:hypothetical protein
MEVAQVRSSVQPEPEQRPGEMTPRPLFYVQHTKRPGLLRGPGRYGAAWAS